MYSTLLDRTSSSILPHLCIPDRTTSLLSASIQFRVLILVFKAQLGLAPPKYLCDLILHPSPSLLFVRFDCLIGLSSLFPAASDHPWLSPEPLHALVPLYGIDFPLQSTQPLFLVVFLRFILYYSIDYCPIIVLSSQILSFLSRFPALRALLKGSSWDHLQVVKYNTIRVVTATPHSSHTRQLFNEFGLNLCIVKKQPSSECIYM